jgi:hypothetical protein
MQQKEIDLQIISKNFHRNKMKERKKKKDRKER